MTLLECFTAGQKSHAVYETPPFFSFHHINSFEASGQQLVVDTVAIAGIDFSQSLDSGTSMFTQQTGRGCPTRLVINGKTGQVRCFTVCVFMSMIQAPAALGNAQAVVFSPILSSRAGLIR